MAALSTKPKLAIGADFLVSFSRLPQAQQKKVRAFLEKFTEHPDASTHNYEKIHGAQDPRLRSVRIDGNYRGILLKPDEGNLYVMLWVAAHDDAYNWATRRVCQVHPQTGSLQVVLTEEKAVEPPPSPAEQPVASQAPQPTPILANFTKDDLLSLGVPEQHLALVLRATSDAEIDHLQTVLPKDAFEAVFLLAAGYGLNEVKEELAITRPAAIDPTDFSGALERDTSRRHFVVVTTAHEMEQILAAPLEQWRVFLHPSQRRLVERSASGPVRVLGTAGTGKTVVAMHRAVWLARNCSADDKILVTTFSRNLAADIAANLKTLCSREEWERIEVINLDAWTRRFLDKQGYPLAITYEDALRKELWDKALASVPAIAEFTSVFIREEWDNVIQAYGIEDVQGYFRTTRSGRTRRLGRSERARLWPVFAEYRALLTERGIIEPADAFRVARQLLESQSTQSRYRHIVVDEAQDFGNEAFRLLRAMVPSGANDLFIVGDAHQRIYGQRVVLSRCGVDIRGRGRKLRINYRTTEELKNWASGLLKGIPFDDLDAGLDDEAGVCSLMRGPPPTIEDKSSLVAAAEAAAQHIGELIRDGAAPEAICLVARSHKDLDVCQEYLTPTIAGVHRIDTGQADDRTKPGLRLATIHRVKGLEFDHVVIIASEHFAQNDIPGDEQDQQNRSLLYVAATRARNSLSFYNTSPIKV